MASNSHGNDNEKDLQKAIDGKCTNELNDNLKSFINFIAEKEGIQINETTKIRAVNVGGNYKSDINLSILDNTYGVSVKTGSGNSIHQEKSSEFVNFIKNELNASSNICDNFIWFIDSLDDASTLKKENPAKINELRSFVDQNRNALSNRFLRTGLNTSNFVDYVYYGTPSNGIWGRIDEIFELIENTKSSTRGALKMGPLGLQAWNRTNEKKRYTLQVKWTSIENDLKSLN